MTNVGFRKRSRSREDFGEEFPLSKRINNLQISGEFTFTQIPINHHLQQKDLPPCQSNLNTMPAYNPELNYEQNPNYYRQNNVLYDLYMERMRRNNKNPVL